VKDLKALQKMERKKQDAWAAFFNGARSRMIIFEGREGHMFFGKAECEWVPAEFWTKELVDLGWVRIEDGDKRPALGMNDLPEGRKPWCWDREIIVTDRGWDVREADLSDFRKRMEKLRKKEAGKPTV
jgi:hypothetical protein